MIYSMILIFFVINFLVSAEEPQENGINFLIKFAKNSELLVGIKFNLTLKIFESLDSSKLGMIQLDTKEIEVKDPQCVQCQESIRYNEVDKDTLSRLQSCKIGIFISSTKGNEITSNNNKIKFKNEHCNKKICF